MTQETDRLKTMAKNAPGQVAKIENSIAQVDATVESLTKEATAIKEGVCDNAKTEATDIINNTIFPDKSTDPGDYVDLGPTFGVIQWDPLGNLTDWTIKDSTGNEIYSYTPGDYLDLDDLVADYAFGNDYLTRPPTTGATYGLYPKIASLGTAAALLESNADKVADSQAVFERYAT